VKAQLHPKMKIRCFKYVGFDFVFKGTLYSHMHIHPNK